MNKKDTRLQRTNRHLEQATSQGESRTLPKHSQTAGYRIYSGITDSMTDKRFWTVSGAHSEILNDRTIVNSNTMQQHAILISVNLSKMSLV